MTSRDACEEWDDRLVDYADAELTEAEAGALAEHLEQCPRCRRRLDVLDRSLAIAQALWTDAATELESLTVSGLTRRYRHRMWRRGLIGAAAVAALLTAASVPFWPRPQPEVAPRAAPRLTLAQLEREISEAGIAAEMLAAADMLAAVPGGEPYATERLRLLVECYPETHAARRARMRLGAARERTMP